MRNAITALLLIFVIASAVLHAEVVVIPVVGQGWKIMFAGPVLAVESQEYDADGMLYRGNAGRFNVTARVKTGKGSVGDNKACRDSFWQKAGEDATIQKESVKQWSAPACECVDYVTASESEGTKTTAANLNCYFEVAGKWVEVHATVTDPTAEDTQMLKALGESLIYCTFAGSKGGVQEFEMGGMGRLKIDVPAAWQVGNLCVTQGIGSAEQRTLSLFSPTDPHKSWKMTFFNSAVRYKTQEDIRQTAQRFAGAGATGEGAAGWQEIKLKQGVGCQIVTPTTAVDDKPAEPDSPKVVSSGFVAPQPNVLGAISLFADDAKDADFLAAIQALGTIEWVGGKED